MLKLIHTLTNKEFELPRNTKIPFLFFNPIFEEQGSTTYSATMSGQSAVNRQLTGYQHRPGKQNNSGTLIPVWLEHSGQRKRCTLNIIEADANEIKYNLLIDEGSFLAEHGDKKLNELDYGGEKTLPTVEHGPIYVTYLPEWDNDFHKKKYPEANVVFPTVYNNQFYDGTQYEVDYKAHGNFLNLPFSAQTTVGISLYPIVPMPFLMFLINSIFQEGNLKVLKNSLDVAPFNQLILLSNVDNANVNIILTNGVEVSRTELNNKYNVANHVPTKTIKSFLASLRAKFNTIAFINESTNTVELKCFDDILNEPVLSDLSQFSDKLKLNTIPNYTGFEFVGSGEATPAFTSLYKDFNDIANKLILPEMDYADRENGSFKLNGIYKMRVPEDSLSNMLGYKYYQLVFNTDTSVIEWLFLGYSDIGNIYIGTPENRLKIESEFGFTFDASYFGVTMPNYQATGISEFIDINAEKDFGMILAFYKAATVEKPYPEASFIDGSDINDFQNALISGTERGTINKFFKRTMDFNINKGRIYETVILLPTAQLFNFKWAKKYKIHQGTYIVKNIKGNFTMDGIEYTSAEVVEV